MEIYNDQRSLNLSLLKTKILTLEDVYDFCLSEGKIIEYK